MAKNTYAFYVDGFRLDVFTAVKALMKHEADRLVEKWCEFKGIPTKGVRCMRVC